MEVSNENATEALIEEIGIRRTHILQKFGDFEKSALKKREFLQQSCQFQHFQRNVADVLQNLEDLIENAEKVLVKHNYEHLNRASKQLDRLKSEGIALERNVKATEKSASRLAEEGHYAGKEMQENADSLRDKWEYLMKIILEKFDDVQSELVSIGFCHKCEFLLEWMQKVKNCKWTSENNRFLFDDIRKKSVYWDEICAIFESMKNCSQEDLEIYQQVDEKWDELQKFVHCLMRELNENERVSQFIDNADEIRKWMDEKKREMREKYDEMGVEDSLKYRKTVEIEIGSVQRRLDGLKGEKEGFEGSRRVLEEEVEKTEKHFLQFSDFIKKWMVDVEKKADMDFLNKEAEDIIFWCAEKMEDLSNMQHSESVNCEEITTWIETNTFDFNAWDIAVEEFVKKAQRLLEKQVEVEKVRLVLDAVRKSYELAKRTAMEVNKRLEEIIETIEVEQQIFQTHAKTTRLVSLLKNEWNGEGSEVVEKMVEINNDLARRCSSVVDQIESLEKSVKIKKLSSEGLKCIDEMGVMKEKLAVACAERQTILQKKLDALYLLDSCEELKCHTNLILESMQSEILKESKLKNSKNRIQPIRDQLDTINSDFECILPSLSEENIKESILKNISEIRNSIHLLEIEHEMQLKGYEEKRLVDNTAKFVERLERWVVDSSSKIYEDETDSLIESQNLRRNIANCRHFLSACNGYKKAIQKRLEENEGNSSTEVHHLLNSVQNTVDRFTEEIQSRIDLVEIRLTESELITELSGHNEWIKGKIRYLTTDPMCDNLLSAQKLSRRYENDSEEIENRRKGINELIADSKGGLVEEIEENWSRMKSLFDQRGAELERITRLFKYDEESVNVWEWIREKMMYVDAIDPKDDEQINRIMAKKLEDVQSEVLNFEPSIVETHALLDDALIKPHNESAISIVKYRNELVKKQTEIESDYLYLTRNIEKKLENIRCSIQENEIMREILDTEEWIEKEKIVLNRLIGNEEKNEEWARRLDDIETKLNQRRANLAAMKCTNVREKCVNLSSFQKIDDAFSMLDVFSFDIDRMHQNVKRADVLRKLRNEADGVVNSIDEVREKLDKNPKWHGREARTDSASNIDSDLETIKRLVFGCFEKAEEVRGNYAELAPAVYDVKKMIEIKWNNILKVAEEKMKEREKCRIVDEIDKELTNVEQWIDIFNEEIVVVTASIHDTLGIQVGLESIDTWNEELAAKTEKLVEIGRLIRQVGEEKLEDRLKQVEEDVRKIDETIGMKNEYLIQLLRILNYERNCDWLHSWVVGKRRSLEEDLNNNQDSKSIMRKISEIEKMMENRDTELEEIKQFVKSLKSLPAQLNFEQNELSDKLENLEDEWAQLGDDLKRRGVDLNESMSQMYLEEEYDKIQKWIDMKNEVLTQLDSVKFGDGGTLSDYEKKKKLYDSVYTEIRDFQPIYEKFLKNEPVDEEKVRSVRKLWSSLVETTTFKRKRLDNEMEKNRILDLLDSIFAWLTDADMEVREFTVSTLFRADDADKIRRKLVGIAEQANEKEALLRSVNSVDKVRDDVNELQLGISNLKYFIKMTKEDLELWKDMQEVVKMIEDEICWFKELGVIVSSSDVGHELSSLHILRRKHQRTQLELERRKQKVAGTINRATEVLSMQTRESLFPKQEEIEKKVEQMKELIGNIGQLAEIRATRLDRWHKYFELVDELKGKEQVLERIKESKSNEISLTGHGSIDTIRIERSLADIENQIEMVRCVSQQMGGLRERAVELGNDEIVRNRNALNFVEKVEKMIEDLEIEMKRRLRNTMNRIENQRFLWKCDVALQCVIDQEERISNVIAQKRSSSNFDKAQYQSAMSFVNKYTNETVHGLIESSKLMRNEEGWKEREKRLSFVEERLNLLNRELERLSEKISKDNLRKERIERLQEDYIQRESRLANWIEQAEEDVTDVDEFQTKLMTEEALKVLQDILDLLRNEKVELLGELELLEVELLEVGEEIKSFTWHSVASLSAKMDKLAATIKDRIIVAEREMSGHIENEKICEEAAELLQKCRNVLSSTKKEMERLSGFSLEEQRATLLDLSVKLRESGMMEELEEWRHVMDSRYIFDNPHSEFSPNGVLGDCCQCLNLMQSMLRSVEQSIAERNSCGVEEKQLREFEQAFNYFDVGNNGWLDYERFELCLKSQGYNFEISKQPLDVMMTLDLNRTGRIQKADYMQWMVKNETTNVCHDREAIEEALKSLDAKKLSDSMSRKESEFFMRKIAHHSVTERVHLEYTDFVKSFY